MAFLRHLETLLHRNKELKRLNIFFPLLTTDLRKFADLVLPKILGMPSDTMVNFYGLNCSQVRVDTLGPEFLLNTYADKASVISSKNYKQKKSSEVMLPLVILKLFQQGIRVPGRIRFFNREINLDEEVEFSSVLNLATYKDLLSSDMTILIGTALLKNPRLQTLLLVNLNLYDLDI